ncbi:MAG: DUF1643 domain-containing protein [Pseudomonadota bacterium]
MSAVVAFVMLNPSTADAVQDDPTIRRCIGFAKAWGKGGIVVINLFAFRATNPKDMLAAADPADVAVTDDADLQQAHRSRRNAGAWPAGAVRSCGIERVA